MAITLITYTLGFYGPGDPVRIRLGENWHDEEAYIALKHELGLDRPFTEQFADYLWAVVQGDFGESIYRSDLQVGEAMANTLPVSATLAFASSLVIILVGIPLGLIAALKHNTWIDYSTGLHHRARFFHPRVRPRAHLHDCAGVEAESDR